MANKEIENGISYSIIRNNSDTSILCKICKSKSFNINDIINRYCGKCHIWHSDIDRKICDADYI